MKKLPPAPAGLMTAGLSAMLCQKLEKELMKPRNRVTLTLEWGFDD